MRKTTAYQYLRPALATALALVVAAAQADAYEDSGSPNAVPGEMLYQKFCAPCHGENGDGTGRAQRALDPPPRNFRDPAIRQDLTRERMLRSVTDGRPGTAMVGWGTRLSPDQIATIVDYVRATFMIAAPSTATPSAAVPHAAMPLAAVPPVAAAAKSPAPAPGHEHGQQIYIKNCAPCHGDNGNSAVWTQASLNPAPRDFTSAKTHAELTRERMIRSVTNGRSGTAMMSFTKRLSAADIEAVVDFIRAAFMKTLDPEGAAAPGSVAPATHARDADPHTPLAGHPPVTEAQLAQAMAVDMTAPFPRELVGDAVAGGEFYRSNCYVCHGLDGDGKGPRAESLKPPPRNFVLPDARRTLNRPALFNAIQHGKPGTVMPAWGKVLDEQQIADVAEYVFQTFLTADKKKLTN
ncbi:MAG: cytochrome c class I [Gammaproteobacteria bacterium]|nr:MAG: cytochrome c class I [Gammaproteobacteria bacterium]TND06199.1 MAG: cytochrome c class I [Gammaproteobacteria bacterium]